MSSRGFRAVSQTVEEVEEAAMASFALAKGVVLRLSRWSMRRGYFPRPTLGSAKLVPIVLCDEIGASLLVRSFGAMKPRTVQLVWIRGVLS